MKQHRLMHRFAPLPILLVLVAACGGNLARIDGSATAREESFATLVPFDQEKWNTNLVLELAPENAWGEPQNANSLHFDITVDLQNASQHVILLPSDYGTRLFAYSEPDGSWNVVPNNWKYDVAPNTFFTLSPNGIVDVMAGYFWNVNVHLLPIIDIEQPTILRVVIVGNIFDDHIEGDEVGAFIDLTLQP